MTPTAETAQVTFAAPAPPSDAPPTYATPTRRNTTTAGLVVVKAHYGGYEVWHVEPRLLSRDRQAPVARHVRLQRDAIAIADQLGRYGVDYTQPAHTICDQWDHAVVGGRGAIARWCKSWEHIGERFPANPVPPPEAKPLRLIAARCHYCDGNGRGDGGYGPNGDQCMRCWDAYPVLRRRGWCMAPSTFIPHLSPEDWRELTDRERRAWDRWTSSDAYRNTH